YDLRRPILSSIIFLLDGGPAEVEENLFGMNFLFTIIYLCFSFAIIVVMSNILIAQLSQTYSEIVKTSTLHYNLDLVVNLELKTNIAYFLRRFVYVRKLMFITSLSIPKEKWETFKENKPRGDWEQKIFAIEHSVHNAN
ncbi:hypothetical protein, partial [Salmonella sp. s51228]|uniref:hypothetical protein n=1 Tax=Salmonella sp. s51228 TaxID=3159652 RepID=UPI0039806682